MSIETTLKSVKTTHTRCRYINNCWTDDKRLFCLCIRLICNFQVNLLNSLERFFTQHPCQSVMMPSIQVLLTRGHIAADFPTCPVEQHAERARQCAGISSTVSSSHPSTLLFHSVHMHLPASLLSVLYVLSPIDHYQYRGRVQ